MLEATRGEVIQQTIRLAVLKMDGRGFMRVILNGEDLWLPPATIRTMVHCFHLDGDGTFRIEIERAHFDWMRSRLTPGSHFIDVGAATGAMAVPFAKHFGNSVMITAFEPATAARALLETTLERNKLGPIKILPMACSDQPGHATFYEYEQDETGETPFLPEASTLAEVRDPRAHPTAVSVTTLDAQFGSDPAVQCAIVKIDVEGFEAKVLKGGLKFLERLRPSLSIDIHGNPFGPGTTENDVQTILAPLNYSFERMAHVLLCSPA